VALGAEPSISHTSHLASTVSNSQKNISGQSYCIFSSISFIGRIFSALSQQLQL